MVLRLCAFVLKNHFKRALNKRTERLQNNVIVQSHSFFEPNEPIIIGMSDSASTPSCPNCARLEKLVVEMAATIVRLEARIADLEAQLKTNSSNSSKPPSSDPPWQPPPSSHKPSGKKPGGQLGHPGAYRQRLPPERVKHIIHYVPSICVHCYAPLSPTPAPTDPPPSWHQVAELPPQVAEVTEHQGHARTCSGCGKVTRTEIPPEIRAHTIGPRLAATLSFLSGRAHCSKRTVQEIAATVFDTPLSLGTVAKLEQDMSAALVAPHAEALAAVRAAPVKYVDESGWSKRGKLCWLWLAATVSVAAFQIHAKRGKTGLKKLLGRCVQGIVCSDRWSAYAKLLLRQICWAHLKRDFRKLFERGGESEAIGKAGRAVSKEKGLDHIYGYAVGFDMTRRDRQRESGKKGLPWEIGKSFDASAPCGPLHAATDVGHIGHGRISVSVNGEVKQDSLIEKMIWNVPEIISKLSHLYDLEEGDLIYTGTPAGVAPVVPGDVLLGKVAGLSDLEITIGTRS